jgi:autotransporter translocation and assembly factor TamB
MGRRLRKTARISLWALAGVGLLVLLVIGGALIALHTDWGREQIRKQVEAGLADAVTGEVSVGGVSGSVLGDFAVQDVVIRPPEGAEGAEAIRIDRIEIDHNPMSLLSRTFHAQNLRLEGVHITANQGPDGEIDLAGLLAPEEEPESKPWNIYIHELVVADSSFTLHRAGAAPVQIRDLQAAASLKLQGDELVVDLDRASGRWVEQDLTVAAGGWIGKNADVLTLDGLTVTAADSRVTVPIAQLDLGTNTGRGRFELAATAADLRRLMPETEWRADLTLEAAFTHPTADAPWKITADGTLAGQPIGLSAAVRPEVPSAELSISVERFDPSAVVATAPPGMLDLEAGGTLSGDSIDTLNGSIEATVAGRIAQRDIAEGWLSAELDDGVADLELRGRGKVGTIKATARVDFTRSIEVLESDIQIELDDLSELIPGGELLAGSARIEAEITGDVTGENDLRARGAAISPRLRFRDFVARDVRIEFDTRGLPGAPTGHVELAAAYLTRGDTLIGPLQLVADVTENGRHVEARFEVGEPRGVYAATGSVIADRSDGSVAIRAPELAVRTRDLVWETSGARLEYREDGVIVIDRLVVESQAGQVEVSGRLVTGGERLGGLVEVAADSVELGRVASAITGEPPPLQGTAELTARLDLARGPLEATALVRDLRVRDDVPPMDVRVELRERQRILDLMVTADAGDAGSAQVHLVTRSPRYMMNLDEWFELEASEVRSLEVDLRSIDARRIAALLDTRRITAGQLDGEIRAGPGLEPITADIRATGLEVPRLRDRVFASIEARTSDDRLVVEALVDAQRQGAVRAQAELTLPDQPLDLGAWRRTGIDAIGSASLTARNLDVDRLRRLVDDPPEIAGMVDLDLVARDRGQEVEVSTSVRGLRVAGTSRAFDLAVAAQLGRDDLEAQVWAALGQNRLLEAEVALGVGTRALLRDRDPAVFTTAPIDGTITVPGLPLALIGEQLGAHIPFRGRLLATAQVDGTIESPIVQLDAQAPGAAIDNLVFERFAITGRYEQGDWRAAVDARQKDGGTMAVTATGDISGADAARANLAARDFRIDFLTPFIRELDLPVTGVAGALDGQIEAGLSGQPQGWMRLRDGRVAMRENLRPLQDVTLDLAIYRGIAGFRLLATSGRGDLEASGQARLQGLAPAGFQATVSVDELPFVAGATPVAITAAARLEGNREGDLWTLDTVVSDAMVRLPEAAGRGELFDTGELEDVVFVDEIRNLSPEEQAESPTVIRLTIETPDGVVVRSEEVDVLVSTSMTATFINGEMAINGSASVVRGRVTIFDRRYEIITANASFEGEMPPNPRLNVRLAHSFPEATVFIVVGGTLEEPEIEFDSDPPIYDQAQLLGFVLGGRPGAQGDGSLTDKTAGVLAGLVSTQVEGVLKQTFPIDYLRIGTEETETAYVTVGKWLSDDLFIAYRRNFDAEIDENANEAQLEYQLFRNWILEGRVGDRGIGSADLLWTRRF